MNTDKIKYYPANELVIDFSVVISIKYNKYTYQLSVLTEHIHASFDCSYYTEVADILSDFYNFKTKNI